MPGTSFDALYADDTPCISENTAAANRVLDAVEKDGLKYGLKQNNKYEVLKTNTPTGRQPNVKFSDSQKVSVVEQNKYLGGIRYTRNADINIYIYI